MSRTATARVLVATALALPGLAAAEDLPDGEALARSINERPRADHARRRVRLILEPGEQQRVREILDFWQVTPVERRLVLFALAPPNWKGASFLAIDRFDANVPDDQWVYRAGRRELAMGSKRAIRLPAARRNESFLGSDFTLEDLKKEDRVEIGEHRWRTLGRGDVGGRPVFRLEQVPATPELARHLGFSRALISVDAERFLRLDTAYFDAAGKQLRGVQLVEVRRVEGFWTPLKIRAYQVEPPHESLLVIDEVDYASPLPEGVFSVRALEQELGSILARGG